MSKADTVRTLMAAHGETFAGALGIPLARNTPSPLFRWLTACLLFAAPIGHAQAMSAARALADAGYRTAKAMAASTWSERVAVLNTHGYARFDESTARKLGAMADLLLDRYRGDLRRLREAAGRDPAEERRLLKEVKGVGDVAVDIFFREAQGVWVEIHPFADAVALRAAKRLGLGRNAQALATRVPRAEFPRFVSALAWDEIEA
ncbi:hypothetical protein [Acuticoccus kandeliae]|uniref:hypothetical protein n=1 Tax=Acuticoccus kandeliae TaxID=2073160 RepID=UPI000D3E86AB|nr:hypothetical protein [Acuticoccus kandeliae]